MEPTAPKITRQIFTFKYKVYEAYEDSFSVGGNRYYVHYHGLRAGDSVRITIQRDDTEGEAPGTSHIRRG